MKKIVVASDSFKGSLSSSQVADAAERGIRAIEPDIEVIKVEVADGGEGTAEALARSLGGQIVSARVHGPLGDMVTASYGIAGDTAIIEMASASGLTLIPEDRRNPLRTSTIGTGELILDAARRGARHILCGIGGSATNDAGMGMLSALGVKFLDTQGNILEGRGEDMEKVASISMDSLAPEIRSVDFTIACDVDTPFCGPEGAAYVFAPQKGADPQMVRRLDEGMEHLAGIIQQSFGCDIRPLAGAGAAGGLGGAFKAFLSAKLTKGIDMVLDTINFDETILGADLVITGEGRLDFQTAKGKTAYGVLQRAKKQNVPVAAIGGCISDCPELQQMGFACMFPVLHGAVSLQEAMEEKTAARNVERTVREIICMYKSIRGC